MLINCRDERMRLPAIAPDHQRHWAFAARYLFEMGHREVMNVILPAPLHYGAAVCRIKESWRQHNLAFTMTVILLNPR